MDIAHLDNLTSIAMVVTVALMFGLILIRLRQPAVVGYILAGIVLGPTGLKAISNTETVQLLAELGVIMLLFIIGMELPLQGFKSIYKTALATAGLQITMAILVFGGIGIFAGWGIEKILIFGFTTALSSTAVAIKILDETGDIKTPVGRTTVSILIAQDLAVIPILLIVNSFSGDAGVNIIFTAIKILLSAGILGFLIYFLAERKKIELPLTDWIISKAEITPLASLAFCLTLTVISGLLGLSTAYGAFIAGLIIGNSSLRAVMHKVTEPIQAILLMAFFLSIGLLIDLDFIKSHWQNILIILAATTLLKTFVNIAILHCLGEPWDRSFQSGVSMAQIGEFSFIVIAAGVSSNILNTEDYHTMIAVIALSLLISHMWLVLSRRLHDMALGKNN